MGSGSLVQPLDADDMINFGVFVGGFGQPGLYPSEAEPSAASVSITLSSTREGGDKGQGHPTCRNSMEKNIKNHQKDYWN